MKLHIYYIYILTNKTNSVVYVGVTNGFVRRRHEHKMKLIKGFTEKYNVDKLVFYEIFDDINFAIAREKQLNGYSRAKKDLLIDKVNPKREELYRDGVIKEIPHSTAFHSEQSEESPQKHCSPEYRDNV